MTSPVDDKSTPSAKGRFGWTLAPVVIFAAIALVFAFALQSGDPSRIPSALIGRQAPATEFAPIEGLLAAGAPAPGFSSSDLGKGKVTVVNFWASWCVPCAREHPLLVELKARTGVDIYGVNYKDDPTAARRFLGLHGNPFTASGADANGRGAIEWGVAGMPETFIVNGEGKIVDKHIGPISEQSLVEKVIPAVEKARGN